MAKTKRQYDTAITDRMHEAFWHDFFARARVMKRPCPSCGTRLRLTACATDAFERVVERECCPVCGHEQPAD